MSAAAVLAAAALGVLAGTVGALGGCHALDAVLHRDEEAALIAALCLALALLLLAGACAVGSLA
ncbi:hypothetical protein [Pseudokineococcus lusitanus]|uniref:Uncharacterized protein n=1 Tax=Pseudokineococcus lusitanus TaxID=763993 RepID=A0A3N1HU27_9ACTN|nr:hypothetical protein [Pseudokineococcus lusitanus]ROP45930.1 hypothetical protein EDC03_0545 [Pseudokineococcus lusitanus]